MNTEPRPFSTTSGRGLFDELAADHGRILELLDSLTGGADAPDKEREQKRLGEQLSIEESKHEALEELFFWPLVRARLEDGRVDHPVHGIRDRGAEDVRPPCGALLRRQVRPRDRL